MHCNVKTILAITATAFSLSAMATDNTVVPSSDQAQLRPEQQEKRDLKTESKAEYKARKKVADVNKDLDIADCKSSGLDSKEARDCKHDAKERASVAKDHAKEIYKQEDSAIKAQTK